MFIYSKNIYSEDTLKFFESSEININGCEVFFLNKNEKNLLGERRL